MNCPPGSALFWCSTTITASAISMCIEIINELLLHPPRSLHLAISYAL